MCSSDLNIIKHARASNVALQLTMGGEEVLLDIHDNGRGFDPMASFPGHLGLSSMRERASKVGGTLTITSTPGQETDICVRIPLTLRGDESQSSRREDEITSKVSK